MIKSYGEFWSHIFTFNAKANRSQYWWPIILNYILGGIAVTIVELAMGHSLNTIYTWGDWYINDIAKLIVLIVWIGTWSLRVRRLHDTNRSGWWILIELIPLLGTIWFFILMILPGVSNSRWSRNQSQI
ncbi:MULTISPECIES: DUF805 domain-containing protein [Bacilli]|uniref:Integral membrane protein n=2 Tax=Lentilactobacillus kefiri TaxID=33962 RepID=A0A8E1RKH1_LENKE|nr:MULTISPECIES: DUF805 domain-containing protein [Bacilli]KRL72273.1 hypothetical protein FD08_GL004193 [Lentilactobacillus parakefiri DSM 10551]KRM53920.1 hypothetical protein FC95_GL000113 [Lentilactobacillus kefiri DSM 20587 = JCM 5818]MCJ2161329.1 DUF805 domain-containing protein [Lentilactobacillus kefiri]MCP9368813.1 DUF805 domain-containing protein [Lentilactobacillus kefiri]MDH5108854.1 DUF805 domain-containing protein [Lentilactobacillus kefiri]